MEYSVDRIEGDYAVCEDECGKMKKIKLKLLPIEIKEGMIICKNKQNKYIVDLYKTNRRREKIYKLQQELFNKDKN